MLFSRRIVFLLFLVIFTLFIPRANAETSIIINGQKIESPTSDINISITGGTVTGVTTFPIPTKPAEDQQLSPTTVTVQPTSTKTPTPTPTRSITPTRTPTPTPTSVASFSTDDKKAFIMQAINEYRKKYGLTPVRTDPYTCNFAKIRAKEIAVNFNHDGFRNRINARTLPYPSYRLVTENLARTSDYKRVVTMWINSSGHAANMRKDTPFVCVEYYGNNYAYEGWKP